MPEEQQIEAVQQQEQVNIDSSVEKADTKNKDNKLTASQAYKKALSRSKSTNDASTKAPLNEGLQKSVSSDFIALKLDAALKRSIADRTGDVALRKEAQLAQSVADRAGARQALINLPNVAKKQGRAFVNQISEGQKEGQKEYTSDEMKSFFKKSNGPSRSSAESWRRSETATPVPLVKSSSKQELVPDASLKFDAAVKRSIADRTGDLELKKEAQLAQSRADKSGARQALLHKKFVAKQQGRLFVQQITEESAPKEETKAEETPAALDEHPQSIACRGCGQEYPMSAQATGPTLSTHLRDFPDHRKAIEEVPEKDRVYVDKSHYKGSFDHNFADPLNFAPKGLIIPGLSAAGAAQ